MSVARRRQMIERERARLSIAAQSRLVSISRGRAIRIPSIAFVPTCCTIWRSRGRVTSGVPTSPPPSRGQALHPDAARLPVPGRDHGLGEPQGARLAAVEHDGRGSSASRPRRRHWRVSAGPRSSIPIRAASSRAPALLTCCAVLICPRLSGPNSFITQNNRDFRPLRRGQITLRPYQLYCHQRQSRSQCRGAAGRTPPQSAQDARGRRRPPS